MPGYTEKFTEKVAILDKVDPLSQAAGTVTMTAIDMKLHRRVVYIVDVGVFGASATVDFKVQSSATSGGTYADLTGKAITQLVAAGGNNRIAIVEVKASDLPSGNEFVKGVLVVGTAATLVGVVAMGAVERFHPASDANIAAVAQII